VSLSATAINDRHASHRKGVDCPEFIRNDQLPPNSPDPWIAMSGMRCYRPVTSSIQNPNQ